MNLSSQSAALHAVPARWLDCGFRLLVLRQYHAEMAPPAFGWIGQHILRIPQRFSRHGVFFANTFRPEIMTWLNACLGRPSLHDAAGRPFRNPRWPIMTWYGEDRVWLDNSHTTEWFADVVFYDEFSWTAFRERWLVRLRGETESDGSPGAIHP